MVLFGEDDDIFDEELPVEPLEDRCVRLEDSGSFPEFLGFGHFLGLVAILEVNKKFGHGLSFGSESQTEGKGPPANLRPQG